MTQPIRIHHADTDEEARARHERIQARLEELGSGTVERMQGRDLPTQWNPIIRAWLKGDKLEDEEAKKVNPAENPQDAL